MPKRKARICLLPGCGKRLASIDCHFHLLRCAASYGELKTEGAFWCGTERRWRFGRLARLWCRVRRHEWGMEVSPRKKHPPDAPVTSEPEQNTGTVEATP